MPQFFSLFRYAKDDDPDNTENYLAPDIEAPSVFGNLVPPPKATPAPSSSTSASTPSTASDTPKAANVEESSDLVGGELKPPGEEDEVPEEVQVIVVIVDGYNQVNINLTGCA